MKKNKFSSSFFMVIALLGLTGQMYASSTDTQRQVNGEQRAKGTQSWHRGRGEGNDIRDYKGPSLADELAGLGLGPRGKITAKTNEEDQRISSELLKDRKEVDKLQDKFRKDPTSTTIKNEIETFLKNKVIGPLEEQAAKANASDFQRAADILGEFKLRVEFKDLDLDDLFETFKKAEEKKQNAIDEFIATTKDNKVAGEDIKTLVINKQTRDKELISNSLERLTEAFKADGDDIPNDDNDSDDDDSGIGDHSGDENDHDDTQIWPDDDIDAIKHAQPYIEDIKEAALDQYGDLKGTNLILTPQEAAQEAIRNITEDANLTLEEKQEVFETIETELRFLDIGTRADEEEETTDEFSGARLELKKAIAAAATQDPKELDKLVLSHQQTIDAVESAVDLDVSAAERPTVNIDLTDYLKRVKSVDGKGFFASLGQFAKRTIWHVREHQKIKAIIDKGEGAIEEYIKTKADKSLIDSKDMADIADMLNTVSKYERYPASYIEDFVKLTLTHNATLDETKDRGVELLKALKGSTSLEQRLAESGTSRSLESLVTKIVQNVAQDNLLGNLTHSGQEGTRTEAERLKEQEQKERERLKHEADENNGDHDQTVDPKDPKTSDGAKGSKGSVGNTLKKHLKNAKDWLSRQAARLKKEHEHEVEEEHDEHKDPKTENHDDRIDGE